ncbi:undecaprenyl-diphosphatase [Falsibacillus pallidus]|uniref:Undecaprenyl-diphosphatase n=1 Tax=Falsibacillus pallidus TaxID=493781 RepID=A0A370GQU3_9BACI|nr:undecaprenyl-diphosphatase [Falsibacillus pallidus]RDI45871.1 undecaprenyl-diphosphatase [Falsibacillus pallidus]
MNYKLFQLINHNAGHHPVLDGLMVFFTKEAMIVYALILLLMWFLGKDNYKQTVVLAALTGAIGLFINFILGHIFYESRPFITHHVHLLLPHVKDSSFPSDHTTGAFALALAVLWRKHGKIGSIMLVIPILTGFSRVYVGHHYPFDVLGSVLVAFITSGVVYKFQAVFKPLSKLIISIYNRVPLVPKREQNLSR